MSEVARGDADAMGRLYDRTARLVFGVALRILRNRADAEEVVLDVYLQAWRSAPAFDPGRGTVEGWLITIARTRAIDRLRARSARPDLLAEPLEPVSRRVPSAGDDLDRQLELARTRTVVHGMLSRLRDSERQLLELAFFRGYSHQQVAALLDLPLGTVKTRIRTLLMRLRRPLVFEGVQFDALE